jgi:DNA-binding NarL/FixJ family response regulator
MGKIRVLLADDHAVLRAGLKTLFGIQPDIEVIGEVADGNEALRKSLELIPDIVLLDITMPGLNGLEVTQEIKRQHPAIKILVLTMHEDESYLRRMLQAGADGYLPKKAADTELIAAIRATYRGEHFIHSSMTAGLVTDLKKKEVTNLKEGEGHGGLSSREKEVLQLLALGYTNQQISDQLYLSVKTVETYKARIKEKLGVQGRAELVRHALQMGLLEKEDD